MSIITVLKVIIELSPLLKQIGKQEAIIAIMKQLGFDPEHPPSDYTGSYNYSLVEYGVGKPKAILDLFRDKELKNLFRVAFNTNNFTDFQSRVDSFVEQTAIGDELKQIGFCLAEEIKEFNSVFNSVVDRSRSVGEVRRERKLNEIHTILKRQENASIETHTLNHSVIEEKIRKAVSLSLKSWKDQYFFNSEFQIELHFKKDRKEQDELQLFTIENLIDNINEKKRIIIKGNPGAGKTISLLQIGDYILDKNCNLIPVFISLNEWSNRKVDLLTFLSEELSAFDNTIKLEEILFLYHNGKIVFLLNGWNEVSHSTKSNFTTEFIRIVRNSPTTSFIISSRETELTLPFVVSTVFYLVPLNRNQRNVIIRNHKIVNEEILINQIDSSSELYEIAQTPLYLNALIGIYSEYCILPKSKYQILKEVLRKSVKEHEIPINELTGGYYNYYLQNIAYSFVKGGVTGSTQSEIISNIADSSACLYSSSFIGQVPNANDVLNVFTDHHLLMRPIDDKGLFRLNHQQFQELYAAEKLYDDLKNKVNSKSSKDISRIKIEIINNQQWEESITFLVEKLAFDCNDNKDFDILTDLIRWIIPIDLFFASELIGIVQERIWGKIGQEINQVLRDLYNKGSSRIKEYALSCIFATGSPDFSDIVIPLIENGDDQIRWSTYRIYEPFPVTCLGDDWGTRFSQWDEKRQIEFVQDIAMYSYSGQASIIDQIKEMGTTYEVKIAICEVLAANQIDDKLIAILEECNWSIIVDSHILDWQPKRFISKYSEKIRDAITSDSDLYRKINNLLILAELNDFEAISLLKQEIEKNPHIQQSSVVIINDIIICSIRIESLFQSTEVPEFIIGFIPFRELTFNCSDQG